MSLTRAIRTVAHLRPEQVVGQVRVRIERRLASPSGFALRSAPAFPGAAWKPVFDFAPPGPETNREQEIISGRLAFINESICVGWPPVWEQAGPSKLWLYNLHYFEYLWALGYEHAKKAAIDWTERYDLDRGRTGWEPYPTSLRLENWCAIFFWKYRRRTEADPAFCQRLWRSVWLQAEWLSEHLETHLLGNHLLENGIALALVGACFEGDAAKAWLSRGLAVLKRELPEQVLADGGHFERSPMYQVRIAYALAMLATTGNAELLESVGEPLRRMIRALDCMCHPDGEIALFNDSAMGVYNRPRRVIEIANDALREANADDAIERQSRFALSQTGYYGTRVDQPKGEHYVICDAGPIGPDYIPGHSHGDIFSFELSLNGRRVVVDTGTFDYEISSMRDYCRSTAAHNTVEIDVKDQAEFWGAFRVGWRGRPRGVTWTETENGFRLRGRHDGYCRLKGRPTHGREFAWDDAGILIVRDKVEANRQVTAKSRIHLHPDCKVDLENEKRANIRGPFGLVEIAFAGEGRLSVEDSIYCPEFGKKLAGHALAYEFRGSRAVTGFCISTTKIDDFDLESGAKTNGRIIHW